VGLPPDRNPLFRDRQTELEGLWLRLRAERRVDLSGMGGAGKSQLAIEVLHRHHDAEEHDDYPDGVFWLRGQTAASPSGDFAALAWLPRLQLKERGPDHPRTAWSLDTGRVVGLMQMRSTSSVRCGLPVFLATVGALGPPSTTTPHDELVETPIGRKRNEPG
jgi:hypothetical protein